MCGFPRGRGHGQAVVPPCFAGGMSVPEPDGVYPDHGGPAGCDPASPELHGEALIWRQTRRRRAVTAGGTAPAWTDRHLCGAGDLPPERKLAGQRYLAGNKAGGEFPKRAGASFADEQRPGRPKRKSGKTGCTVFCTAQWSGKNFMTSVNPARGAALLRLQGQTA